MSSQGESPLETCSPSLPPGSLPPGLAPWGRSGRRNFPGHPAPWRCYTWEQLSLSWGSQPPLSVCPPGGWQEVGQRRLRQAGSSGLQPCLASGLICNISTSFTCISEE